MKYGLMMLFGAYAVIVLAVYLGQHRLLYLPEPSEAPDVVLERTALTPWPASAFVGYLSPTPDDVKGTVLVFHGNAGAAWHRSHYSDALYRLGYRVLLVEYPGYGGRQGRVGQSAFTQDGLVVIKQVEAQFSGPVFLWGESLGAAVVASIVAQLPADNRVRGVVLMAPWDSLTALAKHHYWYLPVSLLLNDAYDSMANLKDFHHPVAVLVAGQDRIIPNEHSLNLFESLTEPKALWQFSDASHNHWPYQPEADWWAEVMAFVSKGIPDPVNRVN
ncbi:alpha/beta fold hydrolase [Lacimicrobium sp. SS2-24]|uniref:alpha/beta hydrolase n=1 Tax=Lacimicrobium sp. SS2-24 TaxID=2005569 RepID=UPI000B4B6702|nr:alpha/beta fold hydrolase [Lacimicrobium sp. SS2-24]